MWHSQASPDEKEINKKNNPNVSFLGQNQKVRPKRFWQAPDPTPATATYLCSGSNTCHCYLPMCFFFVKSDDVCSFSVWMVNYIQWCGLALVAIRIPDPGSGLVSIWIQIRIRGVGSCLKLTQKCIHSYLINIRFVFMFFTVFDLMS